MNDVCCHRRPEVLGLGNLPRLKLHAGTPCWYSCRTRKTEWISRVGWWRCSGILCVAVFISCTCDLPSRGSDTCMHMVLFSLSLSFLFFSFYLTRTQPFKSPVLAVDHEHLLRDGFQTPVSSAELCTESSLCRVVSMSWHERRDLCTHYLTSPTPKSQADLYYRPPVYGD